MEITHSLEKIFPNKAFVDVLLFFLLHPEEETYLNRIVRATGKVLIQVQRAIKRLEESGLIKKIARGNKSYYQANKEHCAFKDLKQVLIKTIIFSDRVNNELARIKNKIVFGFIFGSTASNSDSPLSDIDLFLVGSLTYAESGQLSYSLSLEFGREVNVVIYTLKDFKEKIKTKQPFVSGVAASTKIWLFGDEDEFKKICR